MPPDRSRKPHLSELAAAFLQVGFSSIGGAAAPLRHVLVVQRGWVDEGSFAEMFGICQALPGATGANMAVVLGQRFGGVSGSVVALLCFTVPTMLFAVLLASVALRLATTMPRIQHAELAIAAGAGGLFAANGVRAGLLLLGRTASAYRLAKLGLIALGVVLVTVFRVWVPAVVVVLVVTGLLVDARTRDAA